MWAQRFTHSPRLEWPGLIDLGEEWGAPQSWIQNRAQGSVIYDFCSVSVASAKGMAPILDKAVLAIHLDCSQLVRCLMIQIAPTGCHCQGLLHR
ncbi:hypothetical protein SCLCIDRAFT_1219953 [Scleroderma citrinum Foug A]|uniref:Uncharacterized protein n=1 Tax=Scleroderma citrinum Foug A TaxID=1036808 RepID=A0A0C2ZWT4_9AGAM|nr:hypothetical protein SCLCIDRAFT_1219953 [Scleroderma citrinum Foug A]